MAEELNKEQRVGLIRRTLESQPSQLEIEKALPKHINVTVDKLIRIAMTAIQNDSTGKLVTCDPVSILSSVIQAAQVGLVPDGFLGQAYLVPFWNSKNSRLEAKLMIGYRGYIELAIRSGRVNQIRSALVYAGDVFHYEEGLQAVLKHKPAMPDKRGELVAAYAICDLKAVPREESPFRVLWRDEVQAIRDNAQSARDSKGNLIGPWKTHEGEMWRKTAVRALQKYLSLSPESVRAAVLDEYNEAGVTIQGNTDAFSYDTAEQKPEVVQPVRTSVVEELRSKLNLTTAAELTQPINPAPPSEKVTDYVNPQWMEYGGKRYLAATITKVSGPQKAQSGEFLVVEILNYRSKLWCYDQKLFNYLIMAPENTPALMIWEPGYKRKIVGIRKLGDQEFEDNNPVVQEPEPVQHEVPEEVPPPAVEAEPF